MDGPPLDQLAGRLQERCLKLGVKVATAESCTGGLVAKTITDISGSSDYFLGGVVSYSNDIKVRLLGVPQDQLDAHGAVSAQVARAMALGARERFGVDLALSITGVAGPGGGSAAKPVGLTYVGVADARGVEVRRFVWAGDRIANREHAARVALEMALDRLAGLETTNAPAQTESPA